MVTKVTDSVMDLTNVRQDITIGFNDDEARQSKIVGLVTPTQDDEATSKKYVDDSIAAILALNVPAGLGPLPWSTDTPPIGWLLCDGTIYNIATYPDLGAALGNTYGGNGTTTFGVPDMRGRFALGKNNTGSNVNRVNKTQSQNLGGVTGQESYALQNNETPAHTHPATIGPSGSHIHGGATTDTEPDHDHSTTLGTEQVEFNPGGVVVLDQGAGVNKSTDLDGAHAHNVTVPSNSSAHTHPVSIGTTPAASAHENTPPFLTINYIIKT